jgi:ubiquinone/menaquinone biosynthesis C-methylase UbiE
MTDSAEHLDAIRQQFARQAEAYVRMRQTTDATALQALVMLSGAAPEHRVLDIACGPGFLTMAFAAQCASVIGLDATEQFLELARAEAAARNLHTVEFRAGDAERLGFPDESFDIVACRAAFHHFLHPERVLQEMKRVVRCDGRLLIADMLASDDSAQADYHNHVERLCDPTHVRALSQAEFDEIFRRAGLTALFRPTTQLHYDLEEWMAHGGPPADAARQIVELMEASVDVDRAGLRVRRENDRLCFSHTGVAFLLQVTHPV